MVKRKDKNLFRSREKKTAKRVRMRLSPHEDLGKACYMWPLNARHQSIPVSGTIFKVKALYFAKEVGFDSFQTSDGWLGRWKKRYNVLFKTMSGIFSFDHILIFPYFWKVPYLKVHKWRFENLPVFSYSYKNTLKISHS